MDMLSVMNIFLRQCIMRGRLPFKVEVPNYRAEVLEAMEEAKTLSRKPDAKRYNSFAAALEDIDE